TADGRFPKLQARKKSRRRGPCGATHFEHSLRMLPTGSGAKVPFQECDDQRSTTELGFSSSCSNFIAGTAIRTDQAMTRCPLLIQSAETFRRSLSECRLLARCRQWALAVHRPLSRQHQP